MAAGFIRLLNAAEPVCHGRPLTGKWMAAQRDDMERGSENSGPGIEIPAEVQSANETCRVYALKDGRVLERKSECEANRHFTASHLLQQKINNWAEMALLINDEFEQSPEGFGFRVNSNTLMCGFINGFDRDKGDALTPPGEMPLLREVTLRFTVETTAKEVYRYIQEAIACANDAWQMMET